jgi:hypothetical protein
MKGICLNIKTKAARLLFKKQIVVEIAKNLAMGIAPLRAARLCAAPRTSLCDGTRHEREALKRYALELPRILVDAVGDLRGKHVLEIGPGDHLAAGLVMLALGAASHTSLDRFPGEYSNAYAKSWYRAIHANWSAMFAHVAWPEWLDVERFPEAYPDRVRIVKAGVEDVGDLPVCDIVCSYAVGEHVLDVHAFGRTTKKLMKSDGVAIHVVDFSQHFDWSRYGDPFLFLSISDRAWRWMGSNRGLPNRVRYGEFIAALRASGLQVHAVEKKMALDVPDAGRMLHRFRAMPMESVRTIEATFCCRPS